MPPPNPTSRPPCDIGARFGSIDIVVRKVGGLIQRAAIDEMEFALWKKVMAVNLGSAFLKVITHCLS